jgi:hypothetical protein
MNIRYVILTAIAASVLHHAATGQTVIGVGEPTGTIRGDTYSFGAGFEFYAPAGSGTMINSLGYWDQGGDGLGTSHTVSLYAYAGTGSSYNLLATVTVSAGTTAPLIGGYRWVNIGNLTLPDNGQGGGYYAILASHDGGLDPWTDGIGGSPIMNPSIGTISGHGLIADNSGQTLTQSPVDIVGNTDPSSVYGGANVAFIQSVPEPGVCGILGGGIVTLLALRRKRTHVVKQRQLAKMNG